MTTTLESPELDIEDIVTSLNTLLADEYVLYTKTRNAHWIINESNVCELHKLFETQYEILDTMIDDIAKRVRSLGHYALGSLKDFLNVTHMETEKHDFSNPKQIIQTLVNNHETIIRIILNDITPISNKYKNIGTADFVKGLMGQHEKMAGMLRLLVA